MLVRDCMTRAVVTVSPHTSVLNARRLLAGHAIRHLPVVTETGEVVGMVSDHDIGSFDPQLGQVLAGLQSDLLSGRYRRVETVMTAPVHTTAPMQPVAHAAERMVQLRIGALPVVEAGRISGILSLSDCVAAFLAADEAAVADEHLMVPLGPGDSRPGRPADPPVAVVVDVDPVARLRTRKRLTAAGYAVTTCAGPTGGAFCPAVRGGFRCGRVPEGAQLVTINAGAATTQLVDAYRRWLPEASVGTGDDVAQAPSQALEIS